MSSSPDPHLTVDLIDLEASVHALLPARYQCSLDAVSPVSMGSARLKYTDEGRVAWDQIWTHYCDLALAGGPPHRGTLLEGPTEEEVERDPANSQYVADEIARGIRMTTELEVTRVETPGWLGVRCATLEMASWLHRAVMAENVFARRAADCLLVPAGPGYRVEKEVKNVVVAVAKTSHYWNDHFNVEERRVAAAALEAGEGSLLGPASRSEILPRGDAYREVAVRLVREIEAATGLVGTPGDPPGWIAIRFADQTTAAWFTRAAIACHILARREEERLYLPVPRPETTRFEVVERLVRLLQLYRCDTGGAETGQVGSS